MNPYSSRKRLLRVLKGESIDRIPISLYEFDGFYDSWIHESPEYVDILDYAKGKTDKMYSWSPDWKGMKTLFLNRIEEKDLRIEEWSKGKREFTKTIINTPEGEVQNMRFEEEGVHTRWTVEHFCKDIDDAKKVLSLPYNPGFPSVKGFGEADEQLGEEGILMIDLADPLALVAALFAFSDFLIFAITEEKIVTELLDAAYERTYNYTEYLLKKGLVTLFRIVGPEYATPPYLSPFYFDKFVTKYDKELISLIHSYGGFARLHCHGRIEKVLDQISSMSPDALEPIEQPPDGDIGLRDIKKRVGNKITLMGNVEERCFEVCSRKEMDNIVRRAIEEGAPGGRFVLLPTAMPFTTPLKQRIKENIIQYIDSGLSYGEYR